MSDANFSNKPNLAELLAASTESQWIQEPSIHIEQTFKAEGSDVRFSEHKKWSSPTFLSSRVVLSRLLQAHCDGSGLVVSASRETPHPASMFLHPVKEQVKRGEWQPSNLVGEKVPRGIWCITRGWNNYFHWNLNVLAAIGQIRGISALEKWPIFLPKGVSGYAKESLEYLALPNPIIELDRKDIVLVEELLFPEQLGGSCFNLHPRLLDIFQSLSEKPFGNLPCNNRKIYISRRNSKRRSLTNEAEISALCSAKEFVEVELEKLNYSEQISLFRRAEFIVAPHGAGLANLVFTSKHLRPMVIELVPEHYLNPCMMRLGASLGLPYKAFIGTSEEGEDRHNRNWSLDPAVLEKHLTD